MAGGTTEIEHLLAQQIRSNGPISVASYMDQALGHPRFGYYHRREPFGSKGDFTTAPEISQAFGELLGLWLIQAWQDAGAPSAFCLVELGPGRGQLMADLLRAASTVPPFGRSASLHLVETSVRLRRVQQQALHHASPAWHDRLEDVPKGPMFLIANEFVDALPVHQLVRTEAGWIERLVGLDQNGKLCFTLAAEPDPSLAAMIADDKDTSLGAIAEVSPARASLALELGQRLAAHGGVAAIIDYGAWASGATGDTLQAARQHKAFDPLHSPGEADLTAQVDFHAFAVAAAAGGAAVFGPVPQGAFLRALGIEVRVATLLRHASSRQSHDLRSGLFRLVDASAMGEAYKVLTLAPAGGPKPPGFDRATLHPTARSLP